MHKHTPLPLPYPWPLALSLSHLPRPNPNQNYGYRTEQLGNATRLYLVPVSSFDLYIIGEAKKRVQSRPPHIPTRTPSPGPGPLYLDIKCLSEWVKLLIIASVYVTASFFVFKCSIRLGSHLNWTTFKLKLKDT